MNSCEHHALPPAELIARYDRPGPRYTSYPTAPQFSAAFGAGAHAAALARAGAARPQQPLSAYVHVPFCTSPCFFCACTKLITRQRHMADAYVERLQAEAALQAAALGRRRPIEQLHFGGGTPTFLRPDQLARVLDALDRHFGLAGGERREFSIEIDPRSVSCDDIARLAALGFNRVSLGVQDFDAAVQRAVNREQPAGDTLARIEAARAAGMRCVSLDLIYGLPLQTPETFAATLQTVIAARPDRIAAYSYAHLPERFKPQQRIRAQDLPSAAVKLQLLRLAIDRLSAAGYIYIGMDHFALPEDELAVALREGTLQRNFQGYSTRRGLDLIGLGMSAISQIDDSYGQNAATLGDYYARIDSGHLAVQRGLRLDADDRLRREVIMRIMCQGSIDYDDIEQRHGIDFERYFADALDELAPLQGEELIRLCDNRLDVLPRGRYLLRALAMPFDAYLCHVATSPASRRRHSSLV